MGKFDAKKALDYFLVYMLIATTGIDFFYRAKMVFLIPMLLLVAGIFIYNGLGTHKFFIGYILAATIVQFLQMLKFYYLPSETFIGLYLRLFYAYFTIRIVGERFFKYYVNILYYSAIISFFFYFTSYIPGVETFFITHVAPLFQNPFVNYNQHYTIAPSVIVYTFNSSGENINLLLRNSGPFWESGAFAGFLVVAIIFNTIQTGSIFSPKNRILLLALLTTFSSTGFIVLMFILLSYIMTNSSLSFKVMVLPVILAVSVYAFFSLDFLGKKIVSNMNIADATYNNRFKSAYLDFMDAVENPLLGLGRSEVTRFKGVTNEFETHRNNGVTDFLVNYGFLVFAAYFYLIFLTFKRMCGYYGYNPRFAYYAIAMIFLIGFSESYFSRPLFYALTMMSTLVPYVAAEADDTEEQGDLHSLPSNHEMISSEPQ
jgi:hypothetical protein